MSNCDLTRCRVCSRKWGGASEKACARGDCPVPEQLVRKFDEGWEVFLSSQLSDLSKQIALAELVEAIRQYGREAVVNALRRAAELADKFNHDTSAGIPIRHQIASAIRSLLPKEEGK